MNFANEKCYSNVVKSNESFIDDDDDDMSRQNVDALDLNALQMHGKNDG